MTYRIYDIAPEKGELRFCDIVIRVREFQEERSETGTMKCLLWMLVALLIIGFTCGMPVEEAWGYNVVDHNNKSMTRLVRDDAVIRYPIYDRFPVSFGFFIPKNKQFRDRAIII